MKKKVLTILLSALMIVALCITFASCGDKADETTGTSENTGKETDTSISDDTSTDTDEGCVHKWDSWEITPATCAKSGKKVRTCDLCGEEEEQTSYAEKNPATGIHNYNDEGKCIVCGYSKYDCDEGKHKWGSWETTAATCAKAGKKVRTCDLCGDEEEQDSYAASNPATGIHNYTSDGTCMVCGMNRCLAGNHAYGQYTTTNPTCVNDERRFRICALCGEEQVDNSFIGRPATGNHTYGEDYMCTVCGQVSPDKPNCNVGGNIHNWVLENETEATCTTDGKATYKCSICGRKDTQIMEKALGHEWGEVSMGALQYERSCDVCGAKQVRELKNLSSTVTPEIEAPNGGFGVGSGAVFNNGNWDESAWGAGSAFKGTGGNVTFNFDTAQKVDQIAIATDVGGFSIEVITNKSGGEYKTITNGVAGWGKENAFLCDMSDYLDDDELVLSVKVTQTSYEDGTRKWGEVGIGQIDESRDWKNA